ncbi:MAG TPA: flagellin, partial [Acidocella sp.]|nr:flagellin [Acidocella sp.]
LQALNSLSNTSAMNNSLESQLSSGLSINSPANNPAGYITAQGFTSQINGLTQAISNANEGVSLLQTAQGAITQQIGIVQQLNSIAVQAANGTQTSAESQSLQTLAAQLTGQVTTIANQSQFNNINLLDGSFSGVQLQVGANEGQTMTLSINNTTATNIGMYSVGTTYTKPGSGSGKVSAAAGGYTAGTVKITGPTGQSSAGIAVTKPESAAAVAQAANANAGTTGVQAVATNTTNYTVAAGTTDHLMTFSLQASGSAGAIGNAVAVNASSLSEAVSQINQQSNTTGIVASISSGYLSLTQQSGNNIKFTAVGTAGSGGTVTSKAATLVAANDIQQGQVQFQSSGAFTANGAKTDLGTTSSAATLNSLSSINVSTTQGANQAINVIKYALASLNNQGGQLGAVQQALTANINNMNTTSQNATTALGVVQDANIPQVSTQLTQSEIQAQSGVAALKASTQLQQSYLSLLP